MEKADNFGVWFIDASLCKFDFVGYNFMWEIANGLKPPTDLHQLFVFVTMTFSVHFDEMFCSDRQKLL